jgi:hypothetical protein
VVRTLCWSEPLARTAISTLNMTGRGLQRAGLTSPAIATHKAILALAFHLGRQGCAGIVAQRAAGGAGVRGGARCAEESDVTNP